jgi:hypothetical protein
MLANNGEITPPNELRSDDEGRGFGQVSAQADRTKSFWIDAGLRSHVRTISGPSVP